MSDYIKREDALKAVNGIHEDDLPRNNKIEVCDVLTLVVPSADVVQVIRCKDCKYYDTPKNFKKPYCMRGAYVKVNADDYCSKGEKR